MLEVGAKAPDFTLKDKDGNDVSLKEFYGKKVVNACMSFVYQTVQMISNLWRPSIMA